MTHVTTDLSVNSSSDLIPKVCIIDDDESSRVVLKAIYSNAGYKVELYSCAIQALQPENGSSSPAILACDLIVCDLKMPKMDGLEFIDRLKNFNPYPPVILLTAHASVETAVEGMGRGAFDYVTKPINVAELTIISDRAVKGHRLEQSYRLLKKELARAWMLEDIVGKSPQMQLLFGTIKKVSQASCNVLITGESGTGKEIVARAIHSRGPRAEKPFVAINCSAIPESLLESELFGHTKGSFTGATERRRGLFEDAHEGTVLLDEIGDMPLLLQTKLLRFLQEKSVKSIGENVYRKVDVRVIAATHQNLEKAVQEGKFREDLYYRLCVAHIEIPPLRQRSEDILLLAEHFLEKMSRKGNSQVTGFTQAALSKLMSLRWPGNVRELENTIERAVVFCEGKTIDEADLRIVHFAGSAAPSTELFSKMMPLEKLEQEYIEYVLRQTGNKQDKAAEVLGLNRKTLYRKQQLYKGAAATRLE